LVLENNHFGFNGKNNIQTKGTATGSHLGMNYACTYLGECIICGIDTIT
jgi:hypothetical protein